MPNFSRFLWTLLIAFASLAGNTAHADEFYMVMFGSQGHPNTAKSSHTFATFVRARHGVVLNEQTISWLPAPGYFGANYTMPTLQIVPGRNYDLDETLALSPGRQTFAWGPYEISPALYQRAVQRIEFLESGATSYKMAILLRQRLREPARTNRPGGAINCIMAVSDIGGYLRTGTSWGYEASSEVLGFLSPYLVRGYQIDRRIAEAMRLESRLR